MRALPEAAEVAEITEFMGVNRMKLLFVRIAVIAACLLVTLQVSAQNPNNPIQLALLRWYQANTAAQLTTCATPGGMAFGGANIWVANGDDGTVTKLLASTGAVVNTYSVGGPSAAAGEGAFDGKFIWVSNQTPSTVTKLLASTGAIVGVFQLGPSTNTPFGVAFDGANIWVGYGQGAHLP